MQTQESEYIIPTLELKNNFNLDSQKIGVAKLEISENKRSTTS